MSQSEMRKRRRMCKAKGHLPKTDGGHTYWCGRCGVQLTDKLEVMENKENSHEKI